MSDPSRNMEVFQRRGSVSGLGGGLARKEGSLTKWVNYYRLYEKRWFLIDGSHLRYYRDYSERNGPPRGSIKLAGCEIRSGDNLRMSVRSGATTYYLKANSEKERYDWLIKIDMAKNDGFTATNIPTITATKSSDSAAASSLRSESERDVSDGDSQDEDEEDGHEAQTFKLSQAKEAISGVRARLLKMIEIMAPLAGDLEGTAYQKEVLDMKTESEQLAKLCANASLNVEECQSQMQKSKRHRIRLEQTVEHIAMEASRIHLHQLSQNPVHDNEDDEFFDAVDLNSDVPESIVGLKKYRTTVPFRPNVRVNVWEILKKAVGQDLSKIAMPVFFNEPLSFLQKLAEDMQYATLLDQAVTCQDDTQKIALVAAFLVSAYAPVAYRMTKPFNPLLGETFEYDRRHDLGYRMVCEQVSHHPPVSAMYLEHKNYIFTQEFSMKSKFRGTHLEIVPTGFSHIIFNATGDHFTFTKNRCQVHNLVMGTMYMDYSGTMDIINHKTKDKAVVTFHPYGYFSKFPQRTFTGIFLDRNGKEDPAAKLHGIWDKYIDFTNSSGVEERIWKGGPRLVDSDKMHNFSLLSMTLNQMEENLPQSDSRFRKDVRTMEEGDWDTANAEKVRIEEKQRAARRKREETKRKWSPIWFELKHDKYRDADTWTYKGGYWETKEKGLGFDMAPDIM